MFITRGMRQVPDRHSPDVKSVAASLGLVAASGDVERLRYLLATEDESPPSEETIQFLLASASWAEKIPVIEFLLAEYPPGKVAEEPIRAAIYSGSMPLISVFLRADPSVLTLQYDRQGSALIAACRSRQRPEFIRFLLEAGADPNQDPDCAYLPPLGWAAGWYQKSYPGTEVVDMLLDYGAETARSGALRWAARGNYEDVVRRLLERGANHENDLADHIDLRGKQLLALHEAASRGYTGVMKILLEHGVDVKGADLSAAKDLLRSWNQVQA